MNQPAVSVRNLEFSWKGQAALLSIPDFTVEAEERVLLVGPSGSGKSTFLGLLAGITAPQSGEIGVLGKRLDQMGPARRDAFRADNLGVIFQLFNLVPYLGPVENVVLPAFFSRVRKRRVEQAGMTVSGEARRLLERLGLDKEHVRKPALELSVGQQQRVAAARALLGSPGLVIADEPTSALDSNARDAFLALLSDECARSRSALLFVSHDSGLRSRFQRSVDLSEINRRAVTA
jgi:putative ABC transport system ATP-binding protein